MLAASGPGRENRGLEADHLELHPNTPRGAETLCAGGHGAANLGSWKPQIFVPMLECCIRQGFPFQHHQAASFQGEMWVP